jgi:hypothetical protein
VLAAVDARHFLRGHTPFFHDLLNVWADAVVVLELLYAECDSETAIAARIGRLAAEYSRELSVKVFAGQRRLIRLGYCVNRVRTVYRRPICAFRTQIRRLRGVVCPRATLPINAASEISNADLEIYGRGSVKLYFFAMPLQCLMSASVNVIV